MRRWGFLFIFVVFSVFVTQGSGAVTPLNCRFLLDGCEDTTPPPAPPPQQPPQQQPRPPNPAPGRQFNILSGVDLDGDDIKPWMHGLSLDNCQTVCAGTMACQAFTYNVDKAVCILKSGNGYRKSDPNAVSGVLATASSSTARQFKVYNGIDLDGDDIKPWLRDFSFDDCKQACATSGSCQAFTFNVSKSVCILKYGSGVSKSDPNAISGVLSSSR